MPYLNIDLDYFEHPKTIMLGALLGPGAAELPIRLWVYCGKFKAKDGILGRLADIEIEALIRWAGEPGKAVAALQRTGFIGKRGDAYFVHDWKHHQGHIHALKTRNQKVAVARWKNINKRASTVDTSGIPKRNPGIPLSVPFRAVPSVPSLKTTAGPSAQAPAIPKPKTPVQVTVEAFKVAKGFKIDDKDWDKANFPRCSKAAKDMLGYFDGDSEKASAFILKQGNALDQKGLDWTLETLARHAWDGFGKKKDTLPPGFMRAEDHLILEGSND